ncbi:hypothetical protein LI160_01575 [Bacteroides xylanisolvens]|uniref:DUF6706 family protein n=1 Tax=Bacteroides xylanisolvens TaxID=371601 RepID=UPI001D05FD85|nr:DUF6706 family protein [Bacteroides xylanisolvens]MCB6712277.1 hypothetical protein [Bacteroides xylanisolvens]MCB6732333.1 hypothetical protein [Bacteroides xylanisolvens]MCB7119706.1 hypothetical protein [Bacteroides xylanisolvens]
MTNLEAIRCEVKPYDADELDCEKALLGACKRNCVEAANITDNYDADNEKIIALAAVLVLYKYLTLSGEDEGEFSQSYNDKLEQRIKVLCKANGIDASEFVSSSSIITISDGSKFF